MEFIKKVEKIEENSNSTLNFGKKKANKTTLLENINIYSRLISNNIEKKY